MMISPPRIKLSAPALILVVIFALLTNTASAQFFSSKKPDLLPEQEAFQVSAITRGDKLQVNWSIANDYYMYRDQFAIESNSEGLQLGEINFPQGVVEDDPEFGEVEVYFYSAELNLPITQRPPEATQLQLVLKGQGCNKPIGICYPPQTRTLTVSLDAATSSVPTEAPSTAAPSTVAPQTLSEADSSSTPRSFWSYLIAAFGAGILLSFTPCVLPMIPILAGVIAREEKPGKLRSGWLAACYVAGTIVTYMLAGWVAGASGAQLQAYFQHPAVIGAICLLLVLLAGSLFGWFKIQLPGAIQNKLNQMEVRSGSAAVSSFSLGLVSALVVGACVSPILIVTLGAAITQGDPVLGAGIMGSMAAGMGLLLILFGFGAGWILPKTGSWMVQIQVVFGFMVLGVAVYLASGIDAVPALLLWASLLLVSGLYLWHEGRKLASTLGRSIIQMLAWMALVWGTLAVIGGANGGSDVLRPLESISFNSTTATSERSNLPFQTVTSLAEAKILLAEAKNQQQNVMVDFYATWCLDCKRMHRSTFQQASVISALQGWALIEIDVTTTSDESQEVKKYFDVFGPPATLFIGPNGEELDDLRQYGYLDETEFLALVTKAVSKSK